MVLLLTIFCGFLPALNIVSEKERGTIEQINVTPVRKSVFILSKLIPYWLIGIFAFSVSLGLASSGQCTQSVFICTLLCSSNIWVRIGRLELFGHDAASHVCDVLLHRNHASDEWDVYARE